LVRLCVLAVLLLYLPYFFLPVTKTETRIVLGWDAFLAGPFTAFPSTIGHVALWAGSACLAKRRWRWALGLGVVALGFSGASLVFFPQPPPHTGLYFKFAAMAALTVFALVFLLRPPEGRRA
jgi:peptidoglycan/LPS O-acetylase OafA/YrhL